jgi:uncharacterized PurR-regulated membrane protein YhhQ (DUF165 family)
MTTTPRRAAATALATVAYVGTVVAANWASTHCSAAHLGPLIVPAGTVWAGCTFTLRDLLHDALSVRGVAAAVVVGTGLSWLLASPQIATASVVAFATSELLDTVVYARLRTQSRVQAIAGSNVAGLVVDSLVFVPLAFGSFAAVPCQILGKTIATGLTVAVLLTVRAHRRVARR